MSSLEVKKATILKCVRIFPPWLFRLKGYCRCLRLFVSPSVVRPSVRPWTYPCPHDNSSHIWAGITKFSPSMHPAMLSAGIEDRGHWPWPSRSFWPFWLRILGNSACPSYNSSQIWAGITQFAPNRHLGMLLSGIEKSGYGLWPSRSFWLRSLGYSICPEDNSSQIWARVTIGTKHASWDTLDWHWK